MTEAKWSAVHGDIGEHDLVCNKVKVARFINAATLDGVVRKVNAHDALVAALEFFVDSMRDDSVDDIAQFVDGMYSKAMSALGMFPNGDSREAAK